MTKMNIKSVAFDQRRRAGMAVLIVNVRDVLVRKDFGVPQNSPVTGVYAYRPQRKARTIAAADCRSEIHAPVVKNRRRPAFTRDGSPPDNVGGWPVRGRLPFPGEIT